MSTSDTPVAPVRALLIVNPIATSATPGRRDAVVASFAARSLGATVRLTVEQTTHRGHAMALAQQAVRQGYDVVAALGGDGTVTETVNGLLADGPRADLPALAVFPAGCGNVFARLLGLPTDPAETSAAVLDGLGTGRRRLVTVGHAAWHGAGGVGGRYFAVRAELGLGAEVVAAIEELRRSGRRSTTSLQVRTALRAFVRADRRHSVLRITEPASTEQLALAMVSNKPKPGSGSGLDLFGLRTLPWRAVFSLMHLNVPLGGDLLSMSNAGAFAFSAARPTAFQLDGDYVGVVEQIRLTTVPNSLRLVA